MASARTAEGEAATEVILRAFRANGRLLVAGDQLAAAEGLTAARWQVLGAIVLAGQALTVPQVARRMGLTRQAVQSPVNRLTAERYVTAEQNPDHQRSPLIRLTELGRQRFAALDRRQIGWINALAAGLKVSELKTAAKVLGELSERLEPTAAKRGREI